MLHILASAHLSVVALHQIDHSERNRQTKQKAHHQYIARIRRSRAETCRLIDHTGIISRKRLRKLILLTLLKQEQIKRLLHLLLAFHAQKILRLRGIRRDFRRSRCLRTLQTRNLHVQSIDRIIDRRQYRMTHLIHLLVQLDNQRILVRRLGQQRITLKHKIVVIRNLRLNINVSHTRIHRKHLLVIACSSEIRLYIKRLLQLILQIHDLLRNLLILRHIHRRRRTDIRNQIGRFVRRDIRIHISELTLDHTQTLVDKIRRRDSDLVLVADPILVIDTDQSVQQRLRPLGRLVSHRQIDHTALVAAHRYHHTAPIAARSSRNRSFDNLQFHRLTGLITLGSHHDHRPDSRHNRIVHSALNPLFRLQIARLNI